MSLMYIGDTDEIDGGCCMLFALGTDSDEQFVQEQLYGCLLYTSKQHATVSKDLG